MFPAIAFTPLVNPGTSLGTEPLPQHFTPPASVSAQPVVIAFTPLLRPGTSTGVKRSRPPQHLTPPSVVSAHVRRAPPAIASTPLVRPETSTGTQRSVVVPSPNCPSAL